MFCMHKLDVDQIINMHLLASQKSECGQIQKN